MRGSGEEFEDAAVGAAEDGAELGVIVEFLEGFGAVGLLFESAEDDKANVVAAGDGEGFFDVGAAVEAVDVGGAFPDDAVGAGEGALLSHVPVPAEDGGKSAVPTDAAAPLVFGELGLEEDVEGLGVAAEPADDVEIGSEGEAVVAGLPVGDAEIGESVESAVGAGPVAVAALRGDGG